MFIGHELATNTTLHNYSISTNTLTSNGNKARKTRLVTKKMARKIKGKDRTISIL